MTRFEKKLVEIIQPTVVAMGFEFEGLHYFPQGKHALLRIYIDTIGGVSLDNCGIVSHQISGILDVENPISGSYSLEVSSPGLDRLLFTTEQFQRFIGSEVMISLSGMIEGKRKINGVISSVVAEKINIKTEDKDWVLTMDDIERARIVPDIKWN